MKAICSLFFFFSAVLLMAQDEVRQEMGYFRFMNLVQAGEGNTMVAINGKPLWKKGYRYGQSTGVVAYKKGEYKFELTKNGCEPAKREIEIEAGKSQTLVAFAEEKVNKEGEHVSWDIKLAGLQQYTPEEKGIVMTIVSFCKEDVLDLVIEEAGSGKTFKQAVSKRRSSRVTLARGGLIRALVKYRGEVIGSLQVDEVGNYVAMIYDGKDGEKKMETFFDPQFSVLED